MCGIYCYLCIGAKCMNSGDEWIHTSINNSLKTRGPNSSSTIKRTLKNDIDVFLGGHVLHLQGTSLTTQPYEDSCSGNCFLWNGEVFRSQLMFQKNISDTEMIAKRLEEASSDEDILITLSQLQGPWSFIYLQVPRNKLWFGRDVLGRRSLLWAIRNGDLILSSSSTTETSCLEFEEVPGDGVYVLDLDSKEFSKYLWEPNLGSLSNEPEESKIYEENCVEMNISIKIKGSIKSPIDNRINSHLNLEILENINILNNHDKKSDSEPEILAQYLELDQDWKSVCDKFITVLQNAVEVRVNHQPLFCQSCITLSGESNIKCLHSKLAILFSGGVDSVLIAALADRCIPIEDSIDLLNVAFEQVEKINTNKRKKDLSTQLEGYEVPDRISGRQALEELRRCNPKRKWNFVEINIPKEELEIERKRRIASLIYPCKTVLDDSIGCAVWFAARGKGHFGSTGFMEEYTSPARVVLAGMGADEQLAGYSRHASRFKSNGWAGLIKEVAHDLGKISSRNLGRDDRMISNHGREARFPFLDEEVVKFLNSLPIEKKANLLLPKGVGDKILIRLATLNLGLPESAVRVKRAIQFGSRIAKTVETKVKGNEISQLLGKS